MREAQEVGLAEFLAESREATLWGPGQLLILRRVDTYPAAQLKAITGYLDHPAARAWVVLLAEGLKSREVEKHAVWGRLAKEEAALGFFRLREGELYPVADPGGPAPGEKPDLGRGPAPGGDGGGQPGGIEPGVGKTGPLSPGRKIP